MAESAEEIVGFLRGKSAAEARAIGDAMLVRALAEHTYAQRADEVEKHSVRSTRRPSSERLGSGYAVQTARAARLSWEKQGD